MNSDWSISILQPLSLHSSGVDNVEEEASKCEMIVKGSILTKVTIYYVNLTDDLSNLVSQVKQIVKVPTLSLIFQLSTLFSKRIVYNFQLNS